METLALEAVAVIELGADEVKEAFFVAEEGEPLVVEAFIAFVAVGVEIHFVAEPRTAPAHHTYPDVRFSGIFGQLEHAFYTFGGFFTDGNHGGGGWISVQK